MSARSASASKRHEPAFLAVDFFCGAGGTTRGLIDAGGYVLAGVDKDTRCRETYIENNPNEKLDFTAPRFLHRDIFPLGDDYPAGEQAELMAELAQLIDQYKQEVPSAPLLFAICAPCQPFTKLSRKELSAARKAGREKDSNLLGEATKFVERFQPEMVLSENVQGIKDPKYGGVWQEFRKSLEKLGYVTGTKVVCTSDFGVPQYRKRSILLAVRESLVRPEFLASSDDRDELNVPDADPDNIVKTVRSAIGHLPAIGAGAAHPTIPNHKTRTLSGLNLKRLAAARPGVSNIYLEDTPHGDLSLPCHRKVNAKLQTRCFTDVYTRMDPDRPSPTITTKCHSISNGRFGHFDVEQLRGISLREAAMLQSFPASYIFYPTDKIEPIARMIGNAVPPRLAEYFSRYLRSSVA
ncbi:DNA (cytosine-5-)-methyltransferase [Labrys okinawensis]|uniref:DNA (cytosine-5-)-methyltransferase n=1 Tax=Labrys okinawensis TaxID=346911 RepID=A0A2S9Q7W6_9HYPH|nr:DNA cytosine methyltransferase [Labrys okinawensis]PRH85453.1 DNA (cytosine-5-)-methyltransferase [Labrys okinawensis]